MEVSARAATAAFEIDESWCFLRFASAIAARAGHFRDEDVSAEEFRLYRGDNVEVFYAPFDHVNRLAKVVIVGITPGRQQARIALNAARDAIHEGLTGDEVLKRAIMEAGFGGSMRANLIAMLDQIGLAAALGLASCAELFTTRAHLVSLTSAVLYPVFVGDRNYRGAAPRIGEHAILRSFAGSVLAATLAMVPESLVVPLGKVAIDAVRAHVYSGGLPAKRCLLGVPHPSGANGHRVRQFRERKEELVRGVARWSTGDC